MSRPISPTTSGPQGQPVFTSENSKAGVSRASTTPHKSTTSKHAISFHPLRHQTDQLGDHHTGRSIHSGLPFSNPFGFGDLLNRVSTATVTHNNKSDGPKGQHGRHHSFQGRRFGHRPAHSRTISRDRYAGTFDTPTNTLTHPRKLFSSLSHDLGADGDSFSPESRFIEQERWRRQQYQIQQKEDETWRQVELLKNRRIQDEKDLRLTLSQLSNLSTTTTRRLDYIHYFLLISVANLTSCVHNFISLADSSKALEKSFDANTNSLTVESTQNLDSLKSTLAEQEDLVAKLESRLHRGLDKVDQLEQRIQRARTRIDKYTQADQLNVQRLRGRRKFIGGFAILIGCFLVIVSMVQWFGFDKDIRSTIYFPRSSASHVRSSNTLSTGQNHEASPMQEIPFSWSTSSGGIADQDADAMTTMRTEDDADESGAHVLRTLDEL